MLTKLRPAPALLLAVITLSVLLVAAPAGARGATKLRPGVYDCESYDIGLLDYRESVKLIGGNRYQQAYNRHHATLIKPTHGTYQIKGTRVSFHGGALAKTPGRIESRAHATPIFTLLLHGKPSGITCYHIAKP